MRFELVAGVVLSAGLTLAVAACGDDPGASPSGDEEEGADGGRRRGSSGTSGTSGTSGSSGDDDSGTSSGNTSTGGLPTVELKAGAAIYVGIAGDHAIYLADDALNAVPLAGGASEKIADFGANDDYSISGSALAHYTAIADARGTLNVWTKAGGYKANVATSSVVGIFAASSDGARIAYSAGSVPATGAPTASPVKIANVGAAGGAVQEAATLDIELRMNIAAATPQGPTPATCPPDVGFVGKVFLAAYCTGTTSSVNAAKLVMVPDGATATPKRLDAATNAATGTVRPFWWADDTASKLFVIGLASGTPANEGRWIDTATATVTDIEGDVASGRMAPDGSAVVYRSTGGALKKATAATPPVISNVVETGVLSTLSFSPDFGKVLYRTLAPAQGNVDIRLVDHTAGTPAPVDIVPTATARSLGFSGSGGQIAYLTDIAASGATLKSQPSTGGAAKDVAKGIAGALIASEGTGAVVLTNPKDVQLGSQTVTFFELEAANLAAGGATTPITADVPSGLFGMTGKTIVYTRLVQGGAGAGLFATTIP
jgi:hypothetical protein